MTELSEAEMEAALERFVRNQLAIAALTEEQEAIKGYFKGATTLPAGTQKTLGKFYIKVTSHTRIDQKLAEKELEHSQLRKVSKLVVDPAKARAVLSEEQLDAITKRYDNRIEIGLN